MINEVPMRTTNKPGKKLAFKQMTERPMANIMQKSYRNDEKIREYKG